MFGRWSALSLLHGVDWTVVRRRRLTPRNQRETTRCHADRRPICARSNGQAGHEEAEESREYPPGHTIEQDGHDHKEARVVKIGVLIIGSLYWDEVVPQGVV